MAPLIYTLRTVSPSELELPGDHPRVLSKDAEEGEWNEWLRRSIEEYGVLQPLAVHRVEEGRCIIIGGKQRYECAKHLDHAELPYVIYTGFKPGELELLRFQLQTNYQPWRPGNEPRHSDASRTCWDWRAL